MDRILNFLGHLRGADFVVYNPNGKVYLRRWHLYRAREKSKFKLLRTNVYIHHFLHSDEDRALHDHPWDSLGMILSGSYNEHVPENVKEWEQDLNRRHAFKPVYRPAKYIHMVQLDQDKKTNEPKPVWTLFMTEEKSQEWGFWCPKG